MFLTPLYLLLLCTRLYRKPTVAKGNITAKAGRRKAMRAMSKILDGDAERKGQRYSDDPTK